MQNGYLKVLILSCSTGEGHNSAAKAIAQSLEDAGIDCEVKDVLTFKSKRTSQNVSSVYSGVIKNTPALFGLAYNLGWAYDCLKLPSPIYSCNAKYASKLSEYIREKGVNCVICAHLFAMEAMTAVRKQGLYVRTYGVLTDYTTIPFYKDTDLDGYFVPTREVGEQLVKKGITGGKVIISGIPVHPKFNSRISKAEARQALEIPQRTHVLAVMTGGAGCGNVVKLCDELGKLLPADSRVIVFTGKNKKLKDKLDKKFGDIPRFTAVAFTPEVHVYLRACDAVISKAGGLSSTEIAVLNVPLIHMKAIPGLETANSGYFSSHGLSLCAKSAKKVAYLAAGVLSNERLQEIMRRRQRDTVAATSSEFIIKRITEEVHNDGYFMGGIYSGRIPCGERAIQSDNT